MNLVAADAMETIRASVLWASAVAKYAGIHPTDLFAVAHLLGAETATAGALQEVTGLTSGATTAMIDRLVETGIARREEDAADGRRVLVRLIAPPQSVLFIRQVTQEAFGGVAGRRGAIATEDWRRVHRATAAAIQEATARLRDESRGAGAKNRRRPRPAPGPRRKGGRT